MARSESPITSNVQAKELIMEDKKRVINLLRQTKLLAFSSLIILVIIPPFLVLYAGESAKIDFGCYSKELKGSEIAQLGCQKVEENCYNAALATFIYLLVITAGLKYSLLDLIIERINVDLHNQLLELGELELQSRTSNK